MTRGAVARRERHVHLETRQLLGEIAVTGDAQRLGLAPQQVLVLAAVGRVAAQAILLPRGWMHALAGGELLADALVALETHAPVGGDRHVLVGRSVCVVTRGTLAPCECRVHHRQFEVALHLVVAVPAQLDRLRLEQRPGAGAAMRIVAHHAVALRHRAVRVGAILGVGKAGVTLETELLRRRHQLGGNRLAVLHRVTIPAPALGDRFVRGAAQQRGAGASVR